MNTCGLIGEKISNLSEKVCTLNVFITWHAVASILLIGAATVYIVRRRFTSTHSKFHGSNIFRLHDLRFILVLLQVFFGICHLCSNALISVHTSQWNPLLNSTFIFLHLLLCAGFVRVLELNDCVDWIYLPIGVEIGQVILGLWKFYILNETLEFYRFQTILALGQLIITIALIIVDLVTKYLEPMKVKILADSSEHLSGADGFSKGKCTLISKLTFWWLMPLLWQGFYDPIELEDLGKLPEKETSRFHYDQFLFIYSKYCGSLHAEDQHRKKSLWFCYIYSCWPMFFLGGILKLFGDISGLVGPMSISYIVEYIDRNQTSTHILPEYPAWSDFLGNGWIICLMVLIFAIAQGTLSQTSTHLVNMEGIKLRNALQGLIYRKTLLLSPDSAVLRTGNEDDVGNITHLMSEDAFNVMSFFWIAHYVWAIPLKITIVMYFLYNKLGISAIYGSLICIITMTPCQFLLGKLMSKNAKKASESTDERLRRVNEVLNGIKLIKLNSWESIFKEKVNESRNKELEYLDRDSIYWTFMTFLTHVSSILITFVTLLLHTSIDKSDSFSASQLFAALALFNQLTVPLLIFPITVPIIISAIVSTKRITTFLAKPEVVKHFEGVKHLARSLSQSDASLDIFEDKKQPEVKDEPSPTSTISRNSIPNSTCSTLEKRKVTLKKCSSISSSMKYRKRNSTSKLRRSSGSTDTKLPDETVALIKDAKFSWTSEENPHLEVDYITIPKGKLTLIVGKNAAGKSSLLAALMGEMHNWQGHLLWDKYSTIAYVPQNPWLQNATIKENILFGETFRPKRYAKTLEACSLNPDIALMPAKDATVIGQSGINLSGGQKQRISLARAIYSSANVVILDDPLSSLDNEVAKEIVEECIQKMLLQYNRTTVLVSPKLQLVYNADTIIFMENTKVKAFGTLQEIETSSPDTMMYWNAAIAKEIAPENQMSPGRTARERWKLFKNVTKLGLQKSNIVEEETDRHQPLLPSFKKRFNSIRARFLAHDLPLPIDECNDGDLHLRRHATLRRRNCNSLDTRRIQGPMYHTTDCQEKKPVARHVSSPIALFYNGANNNREFLDDGYLGRKKNFRSFIRRLSSRRKPPSTETSCILREIRPNGSIQSINEEASSPQTKQKLISSIPRYTEEVEEPCPLETSTSECLMSEEERKYGEIPRHIYKLYAKSCGIRIVVATVVTALCCQLFRVYTDVWLQYWTNDDVEIADFGYYFKVYSILSVMCLIFAMITSPMGQIAGRQARCRLHENLIDSMFGNSLYYFQVNPIGRIMNRFSNDISIIDKKIASTAQRLLQFLLLCLCAILINTAITIWFLLLTVPICALYYVVQKFYRCSSRELQRIDSITNTPIISHFTETISGVTTIRAYNQESRFMEMLFRKIEANNVAFNILNSSNRWLGIALDYMGGFIVFCAVLTALVMNQYYPGEISPSLVGLAINYTLLIPIYLNWVVKLYADMEMYIGAVERIQYYIESGDKEPERGEGKSVPISWPQKGDIIFEGVSLKYEKRRDCVVKNINLRIPAGQKIGICGRTGSGKSSLCLSLFRAIKISHGRILIDDVDISTICLEDLRCRLSIIPQDVFLFSGTVRENLDPRGYFSDHELWSALETVQLKDLIHAQTAGLNHEIQEGGINFSAGQRQLFCLARSVLRGSICLVMDEATSSLDSQTETQLLKAVNKSFQNKTIISIAHRAYTLLDFDRVIVLENGQIVEDGDPKVLEIDSESKFYGLLKSFYNEK